MELINWEVHTACLYIHKILNFMKYIYIYILNDAHEMQKHYKFYSCDKLLATNVDLINLNANQCRKNIVLMITT